MELNIKETLRYLGIKGEADASTLALVHRCGDELLRACRPKHIYKSVPIRLSEDRVFIGEAFSFTSKALSKNLAGCPEAVLFAASLGLESDRLLQKYIRFNLAAAAVIQAAAAALIEDYCDACQKEIEMQAETRGLFVRPRFSPGYGDVSLAVQKDFTAFLDTPKTIGLHLNPSCIMIPEKSVTAFMGLSPLKLHCVIQGCEACPAAGCLYRRN